MSIELDPRELLNSNNEATRNRMSPLAPNERRGINLLNKFKEALDPS